jgi:hypothetical protein
MGRHAINTMAAKSLYVKAHRGTGTAGALKFIAGFSGFLVAQC